MNPLYVICGAARLYMTLRMREKCLRTYNHVRRDANRVQICVSDVTCMTHKYQAVWNFFATPIINSINSNITSALRPWTITCNGWRPNSCGLHKNLKIKNILMCGWNIFFYYKGFRITILVLDQSLMVMIILSLQEVPLLTLFCNSQL